MNGQRADVVPMGFSRDPGSLPFVTIRDADKWAPRLTNGMIEIHGEHGCMMPYQKASVVRIRPYEGECPPHLANVYKGKKLVSVDLDMYYSPEELKAVGIAAIKLYEKNRLH